VTEITLEFIARRLDQLQADIGDLRDQNTVLTAMVGRVESAIGLLAIELRGTNGRIDRLLDRVQKIERTV